MKKNQIEIYATLSDLAGVAAAVEVDAQVYYTVCGLFDTAALTQFRTFPEVTPSLYEAPPGPSLLVQRRGDLVSVGQVRQRVGGVRFAVDQRANPKSVVVRPSALVGDATLLSGQVGTVHDTSESLALYQLFHTQIKRRFVKVKSYWVGPQALAMLDAGGRLAPTLKGDSRYDLTRG